eukprot:44525_1
MIHIPSGTKFVTFGDFLIQYVEDKNVEPLFNLFKILHFHHKITASQFSDIAWNNASWRNIYPSKNSITTMISKNKTTRVNDVSSSIITNKKDEEICKLEAKIKMLSLQKNEIKRAQHQNTNQMYRKYLRALSFGIREKVTDNVYKDIRAESIKYAREAKNNYGQPIRLSSLETVKNMRNCIISGKAGIFFDGMEVEIPYEEVKLCVEIKGYLYSSTTLIAISSIKLELRVNFSRYIQRIIGHGYFNIVMSVTLGTAQIGFADAEDKVDAMDKLKPYAKRNDFRINQSYTKPITPFAAKNIAKHFLCVMSKYGPKQDIDLNPIYDIYHSLFIDKIEHFTCGNSRFWDETMKYICDGITDVHETYNHVKGENKSVLYWEKFFGQINEINGKIFELKAGAKCRYNFGELLGDHVMIKNIGYCGNQDPFSAAPREFWLTLSAICSIKAIRFDGGYLLELWEWFMKSRDTFIREFKLVNNKLPTRTTIKAFRMKLKQINSSLPTRKPLWGGFSNIIARNFRFKIPGMHDSLYLVWAPLKLNLKYLPLGCFESKKIIVTIKQFNHAEKVTQSIKKIRNLNKLLLKLVPYLENVDQPEIRQGAVVIKACEYIVNQIVYRSTPVALFDLALLEAWLDIYRRIFYDVCLIIYEDKNNPMRSIHIHEFSQNLNAWCLKYALNSEIAMFKLNEEQPEAQQLFMVLELMKIRKRTDFKNAANRIEMDRTLAPLHWKSKSTPALYKNENIEIEQTIFFGHCNIVPEKYMIHTKDEQKDKRRSKQLRLNFQATLRNFTDNFHQYCYVTPSGGVIVSRATKQFEIFNLLENNKNKIQVICLPNCQQCGIFNNKAPFKDVMDGIVSFM